MILCKRLEVPQETGETKTSYYFCGVWTLFNNQNTSAVGKQIFLSAYFAVPTALQFTANVLSPPKRIICRLMRWLHSSRWLIARFCLLLLNRCDSPPSHSPDPSALRQPLTPMHSWEGMRGSASVDTHSPPNLFVGIVVIRQAPHLPQNGSLVLHWLYCFLSLCREHQHLYVSVFGCACVPA